MENKYYKPDLEEFHLGFEYEAETTNYPDKNNWHPETFYLNKSHLDIVTINTLYNNKVRVKYLNKEDIESLGFKEQSKNYYFKDAPGSLGYWTDILLDVRWGLDKIVIKGFRVSLAHESEFLFQGKIKNKSEFKRILKQINVCQ